LSSHSPWRNGPAGILESKDGGTTWIIHQPAGGFNGSGTFGIEFLYDPSHGVGDTRTWLYMGDGGFLRTTDAGATWANVASNINAPHGLDVLHRARNGYLYAGAFQYPVRSTDNGLTWKATSTGLTYSEYYCVMSDGVNLYTAVSTGGAPGNISIMTSKESDGLTWTACDGGKEKFVDGPITMAFDSVNQILYGASWKAGVLAMKLGTTPAIDHLASAAIRPTPESIAVRILHNDRLLFVAQSTGVRQAFNVRGVSVKIHRQSSRSEVEQ
jgi:hypothetical protein